MGLLVLSFISVRLSSRNNSRKAEDISKKMDFSNTF